MVSGALGSHLCVWYVFFLVSCCVFILCSDAGMLFEIEPNMWAIDYLHLNSCIVVLLMDRTFWKPLGKISELLGEKDK